MDSEVHITLLTKITYKKHYQTRNIQKKTLPKIIPVPLRSVTDEESKKRMRFVSGLNLSRVKFPKRKGTKSLLNLGAGFLDTAMMLTVDVRGLGGVVEGLTLQGTLQKV